MAASFGGILVPWNCPRVAGGGDTVMTDAAPSLTRNQTLVFEALAGAPEPLSAYAILHRLRDEGLRAPLQIYRALDKLQEYGLVHRLESKSAFVACTHQHSDVESTATFAICEACGRVTELVDAALDRSLAELSDANGFRLKKAAVELRGLCEDCQPA